MCVCDPKKNLVQNDERPTTASSWFLVQHSSSTTDGTKDQNIQGGKDYFTETRNQWKQEKRQEEPNASFQQTEEEELLQMVDGSDCHTLSSNVGVGQSRYNVQSLLPIDKARMRWGLFCTGQ